MNDPRTIRLTITRDITREATRQSLKVRPQVRTGLERQKNNLYLR